MVLVQPAPRHDRGQRSTVEVGFLFGPSQCVGRAVRFVDADNDAPASRLSVHVTAFRSGAVTS
jgi:hypothetical protein